MSEGISASRRSRTLTVILSFVLVGVRTGCHERFYNNSGDCTKCPPRCTYCNSTEFCYKCDDGYSGTVCTHTCVNCKPGTACIKDSGFCEEGCKDGLGGQHCNITCDIKCRSCIRKDTTKCLTCRNNRSCEIFFPDDCYSQHCDGNHCSNGCLTGFWGESCENKCPEPCYSPRSDLQVTDVYKPALAVLSILLVTLLIAVLAVQFCKRRSARQQDIHSQVVMCNPEHRRRLTDAENRPGTSQENIATSMTIEVQDTVAHFSGSKELSYFSPLCKNDDLQNQYKNLAKSTSTTRSETDKSGRQNDLTQKTLNTADKTGDRQYEEIQDYETHTSDKVSDYITPVN